MSSLPYCSVCLSHTLLSPFVDHYLHPPSISVWVFSLVFCLLTGFTNFLSHLSFFHSDHMPSHFRSFCFNILYQDSTVGRATQYMMDGPGIESGGSQDFPHPSRLALGPTQPHIQGVLGLFHGGKVAELWHCPPTPIQCRG